MPTSPVSRPINTESRPRAARPFTVAPTQKTPSCGARRHAKVLSATPTGASTTPRPNVGMDAAPQRTAQTSAAHDHLREAEGDAPLAGVTCERIIVVAATATHITLYSAFGCETGHVAASWWSPRTSRGVGELGLTGAAVAQAGAVE